MLQAFASGLPVIASSMGAEGIRYNVEQDILLADTPEQFLTKIEQLTINEKYYADIISNALKNINNNYSWDSILQPLETLLKR